MKKFFKVIKNPLTNKVINVKLWDITIYKRNLFEWQIKRNSVKNEIAIAKLLLYGKRNSNNECKSNHHQNINITCPSCGYNGIANMSYPSNIFYCTKCKEAFNIDELEEVIRRKEEKHSSFIKNREILVKKLEEAESKSTIEDFRIKNNILQGEKTLNRGNGWMEFKERLMTNGLLGINFMKEADKNANIVKSEKTRGKNNDFKQEDYKFIKDIPLKYKACAVRFLEMPSINKNQLKLHFDEWDKYVAKETEIDINNISYQDFCKLINEYKSKKSN